MGSYNESRIIEVTLPNSGCDILYIDKKRDSIEVYYSQIPGIFPQVLKRTGIFLDPNKRVNYRKIPLSKDSTVDSILEQICPKKEDAARVEETINGLLQKLKHSGL